MESTSPVPSTLTASTSDLTSDFPKPLLTHAAANLQQYAAPSLKTSVRLPPGRTALPPVHDPPSDPTPKRRPAIHPNLASVH